MGKIIEAILICTDKTEHKFPLDDEAVEAGVLVWNDTREFPSPKHFILAHQEMAKRGWRQPIFEEVKAYYLPINWRKG
jgi:hypothetical protein